MQATQTNVDTQRYAKCVQVSKRVRFDIERDVIRGRKFDFNQIYPESGIGRSLKDEARFSARVVGPCQGRSGS